MFPKAILRSNPATVWKMFSVKFEVLARGLVNITQHPSLLPIYVLGNCNTQIMLGLQHEEDIFTAKHALFLNKGDEVFLDRLRVGEGIVKIKAVSIRAM